MKVLVDQISQQADNLSEDVIGVLNSYNLKKELCDYTKFNEPVYTNTIEVNKLEDIFELYEQLGELIIEEGSILGNKHYRLQIYDSYLE